MDRDTCRELLELTRLLQQLGERVISIEKKIQQLQDHGQRAYQMGATYPHGQQLNALLAEMNKEEPYR